MIKLERLEKPKELTDDTQAALTEQFKKDKSQCVWNKPFIRDRLFEESKGKCAYCETRIGKGFKEMHIDHFHYKDKYLDEVVEWNNLIPSCPHCNKRKSTHDTYEDPIINPFEDNPKDYFYLKDYRYYSKNKIVDKIVYDSIDVLGLNDTEDNVIQRFFIGEAISDELKHIYDCASENENNLESNIKIKNRVINGCKNILKKGSKEAEYAAFMATLIKTNDFYLNLKDILIKKNLWDDSLQKLDAELEEIKMSISRD